MPRRHTHRRPRGGFSYLELCFAIVILSLCIVPAARMLPSLLTDQRSLEAKYHLSLIAQEKLEAAVLALEAAFVPSLEHGTLADQGRPNWHYDILVEVPLAGLGRYATVRARAWIDPDGGIDIVPDEGDPQVRFDTLVANRQWSP